MNWRAASFWGYLLFVVYGSLVPLDFTPIPLAQALDSFRQIPFLQLGLESRADWVANGVLYAPLGFLASRWINVTPGAVAATLALLLATALCLAVAIGVEFTQLFFPPRTVSQNDLIAEGLGSLVGALAAPFLGGWLQRLRSVWAVDGARLGHFALQGYIVAYLLFCFFPFDLLLSASEVREKWQSDLWSLTIALPGDRSAFRAILQWCVEVVLTLPLGLLLSGRIQRDAAGLGRAALIGAVAGLVIEVAQFAVASAVSQGASVLSRGLGAAGGVWMAHELAARGVEPWRRALARTSLMWMPPYLVLLAAANGAFAHRWTGLSGVAQSWSETRLMPFYYHYFTTEAQALFSLGGVLVMYAPLTLLAWARAWSPGRAAAAAATLSLLIESGKLFQSGAHPDPTNVLLATASAWLVMRLVPLLQGRTRAAPAVSTTQGRPAAPAQRAPRAWAPRPLWLLVAPVAAVAALGLPAWGAAAAAVVAACALAVAWQPVLLLVLLPAALPVFDLAPWTGRFFVDEFDFLAAACLSVAWARLPEPALLPPKANLARMAFVLFGVSLAIGTARGAWPLPDLDANSLSSYYSPLNALRIAKGALWAWLFVRLYERLVALDPRHEMHFVAGMNLGLMLTVMVILWERMAFVDLLDFGAEYRVTGPFSAMHKGGAYIECFLAVASAYTMLLLVRPRAAWVTASAVVLLAATAYAEMVTYSRNGYAAFALVVLVGLVAGLAGATRQPRRLLGVLLVAGMVAAVVLSVLSGTYARQRLSQVQQDFAIRAAHWADALQLRDDGLMVQVFGMGVGRFPDAHFWRSQEPAHAAGFRIERESDNRFLRLGQGAPIYLDQIVANRARESLTLSADVRTKAGPVNLTATVCRKWMLTSTYCRKVELAAPDQPGQWQRVTVPVPAEDESARQWRVQAPLKLTLVTPTAGAVVDVDNVDLRSADGAALIGNGDFQGGLDRWFFFTDIDPPWHIHNLPVSLLFDQGWFGVISGLLVVVAALGGGIAAVRRGSGPALAALAGSGAFLVSGSLNTLIDSPRFLWLWLVLAWLAARGAGGWAPATLRSDGTSRPAT